MKAVATLLLASCGRIAFAPSAGDASSDGPAFCATATGHDEDLDGIDDACDVCPHLPGPQDDQDGDGVGADCDPHPNQNRDHIVFFDPFTTKRSEWQFLGPAATFDGESVQIVTSIMPWSAVQIMAPTEESFAIAGHVSVGAPNGRQIAIGAHSASNEEYYCELYDNGAPILSYTYTFDGMNFSHSGVQPLAKSLLDDDFTLVFARTPNGISCTATFGAQGVLAIGPVPAITADRFSVAVINLDVRLDYFVHIRSN